MRRTSIAVFLAAPLLLVCPSSTPANPPSNNYGLGWGAIGLCHKGWIHQHGPLFNYGPYYGYPPFEPYGPWNAYLQYNPWYYGDPNAAGCCGGHGGHLHSKCGCAGCGLAEWWHTPWAHGGWFQGHGCLTCGHEHKCHSCGHSVKVSGGCASCQTSAINSGIADPVARLAGFGEVTDSAVFYAGLPALDPNAIMPAGK